jgi:shikimate kinase
MNPAPNLVLVGPMGAGKSALGARLATRLGLAFVDADRAIEAAAGVDIPTIFALEGEAGFRRRESQQLADILAGEGRVVATGGGAVLAPDNRTLLRTRGFVVYLKLGVAAQLQRLARDRSRPLLASGDREATLRALAEVRDPLYTALADYTLDAAALPADAAARRLATELRARWQRQQVA